ncbi:Transcription factor [Trypanosoma melophagium]|uniref:Transcription factor n=1 Tax=Trypanosoma melophagium TaxID=715481 RepID=UPI00351A7F1D|nr:Transcription factor [Trypanosoma melophagium]
MREVGGDSADADAASGSRVYEAMDNVQKQMLTEYLSQNLGSESQWRKDLSQCVTEVVRRRAQSGESLDVQDVISEVLPFSRSVIPTEVREGLFRLISGVVDVGDSAEINEH